MMKYLIWFKFILLLVLLLSNNAEAQISNEFYQALPKEYRPKNPARLTLDEKYVLLHDANYKFKLPIFNPELDKIVANLSAALPTHKIKKERIDILSAILAYSYQKFTNADLALKYSNILIREINTDSTYAHDLIQALMIKGELSLIKGDIVTCVISLREAEKMLLALKDKNERQSLGHIYSTFSFIYSYLQLYDQAITSVEAAKPYFKEIKANRIVTMLDFSKAQYFIEAYQLKNRPAYLDTSTKIIRNIMLANPNQPEWFAIAYGLLGKTAYLKKQYQQAIILLDSANIDQYANTDDSNLKPERIAFKGLSLLQQGHAKEGNLLIDQAISLNKVNHSSMAVLKPIAQLYYQIYNGYKETGDWKNSAIYLKKYVEKKDSINLINKNIALADITEKYKSVQKEAQIQKLRTDQVVQQKQQRLTLLLAIIVVLSLLLMILLIYLFTKKKLDRQVKKQQELENENLKISQSLMDQEAKMLEERHESLRLLRQQISNDMHNELGSALVSLNFYIDDVQHSFKDKEMVAALNNIKEEASSIYIQTRAYIHDLQDHVKDVKFDLVNFLQYLPLHFNQSTTLKIRTDIATDNLESRLSVTQNNEFYLFVKEALANILKHAEATFFTIKIDFTEENCEFSISDNGKGFDPDSENLGLGIKNLKERITNLGGELTIKSSKKGTALSGFFPVVS